MVPPVRAARDRGALTAVPMFERFTADGVVWHDGRQEGADAVVFATGFRPALAHLAPLGIVDARGRVPVRPGGTRAAPLPLWLVGYGDWTGFASATLIGVGRSARATVDEISTVLVPCRARMWRGRQPAAVRPLRWGVTRRGPLDPLLD